MARMGRRRYDVAKTTQIEIGGESTGLEVGQVMTAGLRRVADAVRRWKIRARQEPVRGGVMLWHLEELPEHVLAYLTLQHVLDRISTGKPFRPLCVGLGGSVEGEIVARELVKHTPRAKGWFAKWATQARRANRIRRIHLVRERLDMPERDPWSGKVKNQVGQVLVELAVDELPEFFVYRIECRGSASKRRSGATAYVRPTDELEQWLRKARMAHSVLRPEYLPTSYEPEPWTGPYAGGYVTEELPPLCLVKPKGRKVLVWGEMGGLAKFANRLQRTAWRLEKWVLEQACYIWRETELEGGGFPERIPIGGRDWYPSDPKLDRYEFLERTRALAYNHREMLRRMDFSRTLMVGEKLAKRERFWFPHQGDYRGRIYCVPTVLSIQCGDLSRALLVFDEGKPWTDDARGELFAYAHDELWGRQAQPPDVESTAEDPLEYRSWMAAKKPLQYLAACRELAFGEESRFPVMLDAHASSLLLVSLVCRDRIGAQVVCFKRGNSKPDVYRTLGKWVAEELRRLTGAKEQAAAWTQFFPQGELPRELVKGIVMALAHGSTERAATEKIRAWFEIEVIKKPRPLPKCERPMRWLALLVQRGLDKLIPSLSKLRDWLKKAARAVAKEEKDLRWKSPMGFTVLIDDRSTRSIKVSTWVHGKTRKIAMGEEIERRSMAIYSRTILPNFIQALDAAVLDRLTRLLEEEGVTSMAGVHDAVAVHPEHAPLVRRLAPRAYLEVMESDPLEAWRQEVQADTGVEIPPFKKGTFDLRRILKTENLFR